jgi:tetratricopeptide (TPR) repeat protein
LSESRATAGTAPSPPKRLQTLKVFQLVHIRLKIPNRRLNPEDAPDTLVCPAGSLGLSLIGGEQGSRISWVCPGSPAARAGLQPGDFLDHVNGARVPGNAFAARQQLLATGLPLTISLIRLGQQSAVTIKDENPASAGPPEFSPAVQLRLAEVTLAWLHAAPGSSEATTAGAALEQLAREYPNSAAIQHNLGFLYETRDELGKAIEQYRRATRLEPEAALFHFALGGGLESIGNFDRALEELSIAVKAAPDVPIFVRALADVYTFVGRFEDALTVIDTGLKLSGASALLLAAKAEDLLRHRLPDAALSVAMTACMLNPRYVNGWITLGLVFHELDRLDQAEAAYRKAIALAPENYVPHLDLGNVLLSKAKPDEAQTHYRAALQRAPDDADVLAGLGRAFAHRQQYAEAEKWYRQSLSYEPNSPDTLSALGRLLCELARLDEADQCIRRALELDSTLSVAQDSWGWLCFKRGQYAQAEQVLTKLVPQSPRDHVEAELAEVYQQQNRFDQAEAILRQWLQRTPESAEACSRLARFLADRGVKLDEALGLANRALEADPGNATYLKTLGWVQFQQHDWDAAERSLQQAIERAGPSRTRAVARELLRTVQEKKGKLRKG